MTYKKFRFLLLAAVLLLGGCIPDDTYYAPCKGKFNAQKTIDSIKSRLKLESVYFNNYYKNPDTIPTSCETVRLQIYGDSILDIVNAKDFVQTISKIFFNDTGNAAIKYIALTVEAYGPAVGKMEARYLLDRNSSVNNNALNLPADTNFSYTIVEVNPYTTLSARETTEGMRVNVSLHAEPKDLSPIARAIKKQYMKEIHAKNLDEFNVEFTIAKPNNTYCTSKHFSVYYYRNNRDF